MKNKLWVYILGIILLLLAPSIADIAHAETVVFGPETYTRSKGKPQKIVKSFSVNKGHVPFALSIKNGEGKRGKVTSAVIEINGKQVLGPEEFDKQTDEIKLPVKLDEQNKIAVEVRGESGTYITVKILGSSLPEVLTASEPDYVNLNQPATVAISALIESNLTPSSVNLKQYDDKYIYTSDLGILYDDGTHGDEKAGDKDFITQIIISETSPKIFNYRVVALYKDNETIKKVLSDFFSINVANIPSVIGVISPQGGTITLDGYATVTFPEGAFPSSTTVKVMATSSAETKETYRHSVSIFEGGPRLSYEVRVNTGYVKPAASVDMVLNISDSFINTLPPNTDIQVFVQIDQGDIDNFELFDSTFDSITKTISVTLPITAFSNHRHLGDTSYEAIVIVGTTLR